MTSQELTLFFAYHLLKLSANGQRNAARSAAWYKANPERHARNCAAWNEANPGKRAKICADWYKENKGQHAENCATWRAENKEHVNEYRRKRLRENADVRLAANLRTGISQALNKNQKGGKLLDLVGCSITELKRHLEKSFGAGMTWENYGEWHVDHIRPCSSFNLAEPEQQMVCFNFSNLQALWAIDNLRKGDR